MAGTTIYNINKPTVAGDSGVWGGFLNTGMDTIDNEIARSRIPFVSPTYNVGGTTTLDLNQTTGGRVFVFTVSGASTLAFSNVPSSSFDCKISLIITNGSAFVLTFPASVTWLATAPTLKASGVDIVDLETKDGGTTWYGTLRNLKPGGALYTNGNLNTTSTSDVSVAAYVMPANTLVADKQTLRFVCFGVENTQNGTVHIKFGATDIANFLITPAQSTWHLLITIIRIGATNQMTMATFWKGDGTFSQTRTAPTETLSGAVTIDFRGSVTSGGTLFYNSISGELVAV